jgi:hypothetical protein
MQTKSVGFSYAVTINKCADEYLVLKHKKLGELQGCMRFYEFTDQSRELEEVDDSDVIRELLSKPKWEVEFNYDEDEGIYTNLLYPQIAKSIALDEDGDDYWYDEPVPFTILYEGDFYTPDEFYDDIKPHDMYGLLGDCLVVSLRAVLQEVHIDGKTYGEEQWADLAKLIE